MQSAVKTRLTQFTSGRVEIQTLAVFPKLMFLTEAPQNHKTLVPEGALVAV